MIRPLFKSHPTHSIQFIIIINMIHSAWEIASIHPSRSYHTMPYHTKPYKTIPDCLLACLPACLLQVTEKEIACKRVHDDDEVEGSIMYRSMPYVTKVRPSRKKKDYPIIWSSGQNRLMPAACCWKIGRPRYCLEYGLFIKAISRAMVAHSSSRLSGCFRFSNCSSSHFRSSYLHALVSFVNRETSREKRTAYTKRRCGWIITLSRLARTKQLFHCESSWAEEINTAVNLLCSWKWKSQRCHNFRNTYGCRPRNANSTVY